MTWRSRTSTLTAGVAIALLAWVVTRDGELTPPAARTAARAPAGQGSGNVPLTDLKLELLEQKRAELAEPKRDPFRFQARQAAPRPEPRVAAPRPAAPRVALPPAPTGPPSPPPISLRFIGLVDAPSQAGRVAILSDGRGNVVHGREGDTIEGRYRLLKVGADTVELAYIDGRGRQTVRLAGQ